MIRYKNITLQQFKQSNLLYRLTNYDWDYVDIKTNSVIYNKNSEGGQRFVSYIMDLMLIHGNRSRRN